MARIVYAFVCKSVCTSSNPLSGECLFTLFRRTPKRQALKYLSIKSHIYHTQRPEVIPERDDVVTSAELVLDDEMLLEEVSSELPLTDALIGAAIGLLLEDGVLLVGIPSGLHLEGAILTGLDNLSEDVSVQLTGATTASGRDVAAFRLTD